MKSNTIQSIQKERKPMLSLPRKVACMMMCLLSVGILFSCNNGISETVDEFLNSVHGTETEEGSSHGGQDEQIVQENDSELSKDVGDKSVLVIGLAKDANSALLVKLLNASLLDTFNIGDNEYIKIQGKNLSPDVVSGFPSVRFAERELIRRVFVTPSDKHYASQYAPQLTNLEGVWDNYTGTGVKVAVIDSGVNTLHEDFGGASAFAEGHDYSTDSVYATNVHNDANGHGTHVAGIIAARHNDTGIAGVAPGAIILPYRASDNQGTYSSTNLANAIRAATDDGADVINMSLGGLEFSNIEQEAVSYALEKNVVIIAAAGNETHAYNNYPASYSGVIAVGSSNGRDKVSSFSTKSNNVSVVGPGEDILSLVAGTIGEASSAYVSYDGTSMATPYVAGVVALLLEKFANDNPTPAQIKSILESTAKDIEDTGFDRAAGHGRVQPDIALATTTLPTATWGKVEFTLTLDNTTNVESNPIGVYNSNNEFVTYLYTASDGKATAYLPTGMYTATSSHFGDSVSIPSFTISTATTSSQTINFQATNFDSNYRYLYTHLPNASTDIVDTVLALYDITDDSETLISYNDDISLTDPNYYSEIRFFHNSARDYRIEVSESIYATESAGRYMIMISGDLSSRNETASYGSDQTETGGQSVDDIRLTLETAVSGFLSDSNDIDTFLY